MRKKVDNRIRILIENAVTSRHRAFFVIVGDRGRDQIVNLHFMITKILTQKPSVLWCYKKDLGFTSHRKKRMKQLKKKIQKGTYDPNIEDPFELFVSSTRIRYCYYKETESILGQTFGMCILQDFEALTPSILCRTVETVQGGGIVCILLQTMNSLRQLYTVTMDIHRHLISKNKKSEAGQVDIQHRFNKRFILSIADCSNTLVVDDELNILPLSHRASEIVPIDRAPSATNLLNNVKINSKRETFVVEQDSGEEELILVKKNIEETLPAGPLVALTATLDQARVLMSVMDTIIEKKLNTTICITAARGRGKSATLGLAISSAIASSYSNIFVTAPSPENLGTVFEFVHKGLVALNYKEHIDFELIEGELVNLNEKNRNEMMNTSSGKHIVRINVFREHRQTIQYILPTDVSYARQSEILIIDEAAAIPLPLVKNLMGPYTVILSSTINGYEGTGRGLSLKLINSLKQSSQMKSSTRLVKELDLKAPIRYAPNDPIENWLNRLLCLDATTPTPLQYSKTLPLPSDCQLYEVNRDALFSYHKESEKFLHNLLSLFISSHYKSSPNDLILLSDAPSHHIFILLPKITNESSEIPDILVAIHVAIEGSINKDVIRNNLMSGIRPSGDLIPWTLSQNFIDEDFGALNGVRIMRIATHASIQRLGYGTEALRQLCDFFENSSSNNSNLLEINENINARLNINFNNNINPESITSSKNGTADGDVLRLSKTTYNSALKSEVTTPNDLPTTDNDKNNDTNDSVSTIDTVEIPALLELCKDRSFSVQVDYIGVSFGLTLDLFKFYNRLNFYSVYIRSKTSNVTGENTVIMLRCKADWISNFVEDFKRRTASILGSSLKHFPCDLSLSLLAPSYLFNQHLSAKRDLPFISHENILQFFTRHDLLRLRRFSQQLLDKTFIMDLIPMLAFLVFTERFQNLSLTHAQSAVLVGLGLQHKTIASLSEELGIVSTQIVALFNKSIIKINNFITEILKIEATCDLSNESSAAPSLLLPNSLPSKPLEAELQDESYRAQHEIVEKREALLASLKKHPNMKKYDLSNIADEDIKEAILTKNIKDIGSFRIKRCSPNDTPNSGFSLKKKA